jgi:hypothetical protein
MKKTSQAGFALLITLVVVSVIVSIGLSVLDLSIKQIRLSTNSKDSEASFHAAYAGVECARYWRRVESFDMENGNSISMSCFGVGPSTVSAQAVTSGVSGSGEVHKYDTGLTFTWGSGFDTRCTKMTMVVASSTAPGAGVTITNAAIKTHIPGYPETTNKVCAAGERCTIMSVRGYNGACSADFGFGTLEREVLLQF